MRRRRLGPTGAVLVVLAVSTGCGGSPAPTPTPSMEPLRPIDACAATVVVPLESQQLDPSATEPPTAVLAVGGALGFTVPADARVGVLGPADAELDATLCSAPADPADATGALTLVAQGAGYLRVGVQVGVEPVARVFVQVTG